MITGSKRFEVFSEETHCDTVKKLIECGTNNAFYVTDALFYGSTQINIGGVFYGEITNANGTSFLCLYYDSDVTGSPDTILNFINNVYTSCEDCEESIIPSPTPTSSVTPTPTHTPTNTPTPSITPSITPTLSLSATPGSSPTGTPQPTITPSFTPTLTPEPTQTQTLTPTITPSPTRTPTVTPSHSQTPTPTVTPTVTPSTGSECCTDWGLYGGYDVNVGANFRVIDCNGNLYNVYVNPYNVVTVCAINVIFLSGGIGASATPDPGCVCSTPTPTPTVTPSSTPLCCTDWGLYGGYDNGTEFIVTDCSGNVYVIYVNPYKVVTVCAVNAMPIPGNNFTGTATPDPECVCSTPTPTPTQTSTPSNTPPNTPSITPSSSQGQPQYTFVYSACSSNSIVAQDVSVGPLSIGTTFKYTVGSTTTCWTVVGMFQKPYVAPPNHVLTTSSTNIFGSPSIYYANCNACTITLGTPSPSPSPSSPTTTLCMNFDWLGTGVIPQSPGKSYANSVTVSSITEFYLYDVACLNGNFEALANTLVTGFGLSVYRGSTVGNFTLNTLTNNSANDYWTLGVTYISGSMSQSPVGLPCHQPSTFCFTQPVMS